MRIGRQEEAVAPLERAIPGLSDHHPDDALAATLDLVCVLAQLGRNQDAAVHVASAVELLKRVDFSIQPLARKALLSASLKDQVSYGAAVELRILLRPHHKAEQS